eukprot:6952071-Prorocentrum_lima.AAC.1
MERDELDSLAEVPPCTLPGNEMVSLGRKLVGQLRYHSNKWIRLSTSGWMLIADAYRLNKKLTPSAVVQLAKSAP